MYEPYYEQDASKAALGHERLGRATLEPAGEVVAGVVGTWTLRLEVGSYGIDEGGTIKVARRFACDGEAPQFDRPSDPAYCSVSTTGEAKLRARYDRKGHIRPWMKCVVIDVYDGSLAPGDEVVLVFGDTSGGSPGIRAQSFLEREHEFRVLVDPTNACLVRALPSSPKVRIVAGAPERLVVVAPTRIKVGEMGRVAIRGEDRWGNPTPCPSGVTLSWIAHNGEQEGAEFGEVGQTGRHSLSLNAASVGHVEASVELDGEKLVARSEVVVAQGDSEPFGRYWADLHAQSDATVGTGTEEEYFAFGRDQAALDVMSHQGNDFQMSDEDWSRLNKVVEAAHEDGRFVVFPGFEWSANSPAGGDRNVLYRREGYGIYRSSHWQTPNTQETALTPAHPANRLFEVLRQEVPMEDVLVASHCGGRYADIRRYFDDEIGPLVELSSCWGIFEWLLWDAFERDYRVGVMCNSDGHKGRPGAEGPGAGQFGIWGGLTCILAERLERDSVFDALKACRCYGTTGARIDLEVLLDGEPMGSCLRRAEGVELPLVANARSAEPIERVELFRGRDLIAEARAPAFEELRATHRVRIRWGGARIRGRGRRAFWDGTIRVEGAAIRDAACVAFDSPADGIVEQGAHQLQIRSRTTGDDDAIDLWLDAPVSQARLTIQNPTLEERHGGPVELSLAELLDSEQGRRRWELGGMGLHLSVELYPEEVSAKELSLQVPLPTETCPAKSPGVPYFVRVTRVDGQLAWSSPHYLKAGEAPSA